MQAYCANLSFCFHRDFFLGTIKLSPSSTTKPTKVSILTKSFILKGCHVKQVASGASSLPEGTQLPVRTLYPRKCSSQPCFRDACYKSHLLLHPHETRHTEQHHRPQAALITPFPTSLVDFP